MKELLLINRVGNTSDRGIVYNAVCHDGKIHIRMKNYMESNRYIMGFEDKLTFLMVYLMQYTFFYYPSYIENEDKKIIGAITSSFTPKFTTISSDCIFIAMWYNNTRQFHLMV